MEAWGRPGLPVAISFLFFFFSRVCIFVVLLIVSQGPSGSCGPCTRLDALRSGVYVLRG
jgi:hypothetical protein